MTLLNIVRKTNKFMGCSKTGRAIIERKFKQKECYNYLEVPEQCFKRRVSNQLAVY